jgi:hypothetical protein
MVLLISGCFKNQKAPVETAAVETGIVTTSSAPATNSKPSISGTPITVILVGESYSFKPTAADPDGDALVFSVANKPSWASFDSTTGELRGTPGAGDAGTYANIQIAVSDGTATAQLSAFTLSVEQVGTGTATLSWTPPTENTDGTTLTDLAGYKIYYGRSADSLTKVVDINTAGVTTYVVDNLTTATWYFSMTSYNAGGIESDKSAVVSKTIS